MEAKVESKPVKQKNKDKTSFFQKLIISIKDFDKYSIFAKESIGQTILYIVLLILLFDVILTVISAKTIIDSSNFNINRLKEYVQAITYENGTLSINENKEIEIEDKELYPGKILINTSDLNNDQIENYREELKNESEGVVVLKNIALLKSQVIHDTIEISYPEEIKNNTIEAYFLEEIINNWNNERVNVRINTLIIIGFFAVWYYVYILDTLMNTLILALTCYITVKILRLDIKFASCFSIAAHAITLPIILNLIYAIIRLFTDFTIPYFEIMYYGISYVYILTALFMMKSDHIKMQIDLQKIKEVQEQIKEELELKREEEEKQKEKDDVEKKDRETEEKDKNKRNNKKEKPRINDKPEGSNA